MAVTSNVNLQLDFTNDVVLTELLRWASNAASPGQVTVVNLSSGNNTVNIPTAGASTIAGVLIVPPASNAVAMTLKGVNGDTGIALGLTNPTVISLATSVTSFVINAGGAVTGVRFYFF
jgi:hypothetical protein